MKTKELVAALQSEDPSGELEVVAGGLPIYYVERLPAYYDGNLQMLVQDKSVQGYNITGYKVTGKGEKVVMRLMDLGDVLCEDAEAPVDLSGLSKLSFEDWTKRVEAERKESREGDEEVKRMQEEYERKKKNEG